MTFGTVCFCRNDNYRGDLDIRFPYALNTSIETSDEVIYVDWGSEGEDLVTHLKDKILKTGKMKVIKVTPEQVKRFTNNDPNVQKCCAVLAGNIGLRRINTDWAWLCLADTLLPKREVLDKLTINADRMLLFSRREIPLNDLLQFSPLDINSVQTFCENNFKKYPDHGYSGACYGDLWSKIDCCGDFQLLPTKIWHQIKGLEERFTYKGFVDSNINKKVMLAGYDVEVHFDVASMHITHPGFGFGGIGGGVNDINQCLMQFTQTSNPDSWGFTNEVFEEYIW